MSVHQHYRHMSDALNGMQALAGKEDIDAVDKDRFSMLSVIADKHWRVVEKYLPPMPAITGNGSTPAASQLQTIVAALLAPKRSDTAPIVDTDTSAEQAETVASTNNDIGNADSE
jgi:hypothetical protein